MEQKLKSTGLAETQMFDNTFYCRDFGTTGSPVPGILQARTLEWVAISFSNA